MSCEKEEPPKERMSSVQCYKCKGYGHYQAKCPNNNVMIMQDDGGYLSEEEETARRGGFLEEDDEDTQEAYG